jgi:NAD(P)-dependent dehydrogenase (short-subunit alcohol dehydrogenase family)
MEKWAVGDIPPLRGRLAVVTGANSGIGWHTALELARAGSEVILASRTETKGRDAADRIRQQLPQARYARRCSTWRVCGPCRPSRQESTGERSWIF